MDMSRYSNGKSSRELTLERHCLAIRQNKDVLARIFDFLAELPPNASAAQEAFRELDHADQIAVWSVSTTEGGIWERWERDALKYGDLDTTNAYAVWAARHGIQT